MSVPPRGDERLPLLPLLFVVAIGALAGPGEALAQDLRELQRRLEVTEARVLEEARASETRLAAASRQIAALEEERTALRRELAEFQGRIRELETAVGQVSRTVSDAPPAGEPAGGAQARGFEQVGSAWRFEAGGSFIELDGSGVRIGSAGSLSLTAGQNVNVDAPSNIVLSAGAGLTGTGQGIDFQSAAQMRLQSGTNLELQASGNFSAAAGAQAQIQAGAQASLFGPLVRLGGSGQLMPVAHLGSLVQTGQGGSGSVLNGSSTVLVGGN